MIIYLFIAFVVFNTSLDAIGNSVDTIFYILLLIIAPLVLLSKYKNEQQKRMINEKELLECKRFLEAQKEQIVESKKLYDNISSIKHDFNDHIKTIEMLVANSKNNESAEYLDKLKEKFRQTDMRNDTGNPYIDLILTEKEKMAKSEGIRFMVSCEGKVDKLKDPLSVCVILNNALNNAIEACERIECTEEKIIDISLVCRRDVILIIKNTCENIRVEEEQLKTSKRDVDNHGMGFKNIESAVKALGGILQWKFSKKMAGG